MDNGSKKIIDELHTANSLVDNLLLEYATPDNTGKKFYKLPPPTPNRPGAICLTAISPSDFELLISEFFKKRHYTNVSVVGRSGDRGVDIIATNSSGQREFIQCKRWRRGKVGSRDIQRIDSMIRSRGAVKGWVITTSDFTSDGADEARITHVVTMNGTELLQSLDVYWPNKYSL